MIKLIASDIDGTLVPEGTPDLNPEYYTVIRKLHENGVRFAAVSGREYESMEKLFAPVENEITLMAENGAFAVHRGRKLFMECFDDDLAREIIDYVRSCEDIDFFMTAGENAAYTEVADLPFIRKLEEGYNMTFHLVNDIKTVLEGERILKIAARGRCNASVIAARARKHFEGRVTVAETGEFWCDFVPMGVDKGKGLKKMQQMWDISPEETIAFGDNINDIPLLKQAGTGYAVESAREDTKKAADHVIGSIQSDSVLTVLKSVLASVEEEEPAV